MKPWRALVCCLLLLPLGGCLDVDTRILVASDGSGTLTERFEVKGPMALMIQQMEGGKGGLADREKVEEHAKQLGDGVRVLSLEALPGAEGVGAVAVFAFDDVTKLQVRQNPVEGRDGAPAAADAGAPAQMRFRFEPGRPAVLTVLLARPPAASAGGEGKGARGGARGGDRAQDPAARKMLEGMKEMLKGMRMAISVEVDGHIVETNATHREGSRLVLLELEVDRLLEADPDSAALLEPGGDIEAMKEAIARVPGMKVELEREVRVVFTPGTVLASAPPAQRAPPVAAGSL